ncbi:MAG: SRPBCC family protein [Deltaproteobacteria bacterium]|jgi:ligand-binding SRPBCC domain-containing protein|nr:SRPBCC family protein [Deltaproteobacteria bacterium]
MKLYRLERDQYLPVSIETAWEFFSDPRNLPQITPDWLDFKITNRIPAKMHAGMMITYRLKTLLGIPTTWITEITHVDEPVFFVDEMRAGPYRFWHHQHRFIEKSGGIEMRDTVDYVLRFGLFGQILHNMVIGSKLNEIFDYRQTALEAIFGSRP